MNVVVVIIHDPHSGKVEWVIIHDPHSGKVEWVIFMIHIVGR